DGSFERRCTPELSLTNVPCQHVHVLLQTIAEAQLLGAQRLEHPSIGAPRHGEHDVVDASYGQDNGQSKTSPEEHVSLYLMQSRKILSLYSGVPAMADFCQVWIREDRVSCYARIF